jgi:hypothetical protein
MIMEAENPRPAIAPSIGFEPFKAGARVMQDMGRRVQGQRGQRFYGRRAPGAIFIARDRDLIAEFSAKRLH